MEAAPLSLKEVPLRDKFPLFWLTAVIPNLWKGALEFPEMTLSTIRKVPELKKALAASFRLIVRDGRAQQGGGAPIIKPRAAEAGVGH